MSFDTWLLFVGTMAALFIIPGATVLMVTSLTLRHGGRALWYIVPGVNLADFCFISAALLGVSAIAQQVPALFWVIKIAGLLIVAYLAWGFWHTTGATVGAAASGDTRPGSQLTLQAFAVTITNPKGLLFLFGLMPAFIPEDGGVTLQAGLILAATFVTLSAVNSTVWGLLVLGSMRRLMAWPHVGKVSAVLLVAAVALTWLLDFLPGKGAEIT